MIVQIDTKGKRILLMSNTEMKEFLRELERLLPNKKWMEYTLITPYDNTNLMEGE